MQRNEIKKNPQNTHFRLCVRPENKIRNTHTHTHVTNYQLLFCLRLRFRIRCNL